MMFAVQMLFDGEWTTLTARFRTRGDAEWAIAKWRQGNGGNGRDTRFRVADMSLADCFEPSLLAACKTLARFVASARFGRPVELTEAEWDAVKQTIAKAESREAR